MLFAANCQAADSIRACGGDSLWPPMSYLNAKDNSVQGLSIEVLKAIFTPTPDIKLRPWARCMAEVEMQQGADLLMSSFKTTEREQKFYFSRAYFSLTPAYFFAKKRFKTAPISQLADLNQYKVCALHGAAVSYTRLAPGKIESGAPNYLSLYRKVERGYCDIVVDMEEVFNGFAHLGLVPFDSSDYQILPLPDTDQFPLHFAISKSHPRAAQVVEQIDKGIAQLQRTGKLKQLHERFKARP